MPLVKVGSLAALPSGSVIQVEVGPDMFAVCNAGGEVHALQGICPHAGGPLGQGALHGATLVCPWHGWEYDCLSGANSYDDSLKLEKFPVKIAGDDILIDVP